MSPSLPKVAAVVVLWRQGARARELLWLQRGSRLAFGGFFAFPGGKLETADEGVAVAGASGLEAALRVCAVRELFEETGVLLAEGAGDLSGERLSSMRVALHGGQPFDQLLDAQGLTLTAARLTPAGRWITPVFYPHRFDAHLFLAEMPAGQQLHFQPGEVASGRFVDPAEALEEWRAGRALLHPPNLNALQALQAPEWPEVLERLHHPSAFLVEDRIAQRIEFQEGVVVIPQKTPTLPPATHTSCHAVGRAELVLIDPGSADPAELDKLLRVVEVLQSEGRRPVAIALTHHHHDHVGGVPALRERLRLPVWAHAKTAERLGYPVQRLLQDGEELGLRGFPLVALHTPGHTRGHLAFWHPPSGALIAGDLVSGVSTIVIDPPEGEMAAYLSSLQRLIDKKVTTLYPAHGPAMADGPAKLREYLEHRLARERQILEAISVGLTNPAEIVPRVYADTPSSFFALAERSVQAHLEKLLSEGRVAVRGQRYVLAGVAPI